MVLYKHGNRLIFQVIFFCAAIVEILLLSGITYGWASIELVFQREGFFHSLCSSDYIGVANRSWISPLSRNGSEAISSPVGICSRQSKRFNLVFAVSLVFLCSAKFPIGLFIDRFGPRAGQIVGGSMYVMAGFGLALVTKETSDLLFPIFIFFSIGGGFIAVVKYQMCRFIYTDVRSLVLSILHGTFDSSAVILLFFKLAWESGFKLRDISLFYIILSLVMIALSLVLLTPPYKTLLHDWSEEQKPVEPQIFRNSHGETLTGKILCFNINSSRYSLLGSIFSPQYLLEIVFLSFCQLRLWFFIGSLDELIAMHFPNGHEVSVFPNASLLLAFAFSPVDAYNTSFGYTQLCGVFVGPLIGFIFDRNSVKCKRSQERFDEEILVDDITDYHLVKMKACVLPFFVTNLLCLGFSILSLTPWRAGLIPSFVLHVLTRGFLYSAHASYIALAFQPQRFATLYGLGIFASGMFGLLEYPLYNIVYNWFNSDPFWVNLTLLLLVLTANVFPMYLVRYCSRSTKKVKTKLVMFQNETTIWDK